MNEHWAVLFEVEEFLLPGIDSLSIAKATTTMRWMNRQRTRFSGGPTMASPTYLCVEKIEYLEKYRRFKQLGEARVIDKNILMSEVVASAVVSEAVSRISTFFIDKHKWKLSEEDGMERLEIAHIRMKAALEISSRWPRVTDASLLRWRKKLKRASDECSQVMDRCKRRAMEDDEMEQEISRCSFPKRIALATRSFLSPFAADKNVDSLNSTSTIQRFERFADGAGEFLKFMEFGRIGSINYMLVDPLTGHLLAGKALQYESSHGNQYYLISKPMSFAERGQEAGVLLRYNNHERPEENFVLGILLRLTASTNVTGIVARCLDSLLPSFKPVAEAAKQELTQVHHRAFYFFPFVDSTDPYWSIHHSETHRARPNPACCHGQSRSSDMVEPSTTGTTFPEQVIKLFVQRHVSARPSSSGHGDGERRRFSEDSGPPPLLQVTAIFAPHASPQEELPSGAESAAVVAIDGKEEQAVRTNIGLREVDEFLLPGAIDRLCHDVRDTVDGSSSAAAHEVFWRSGHGVAYLCVEKMGTEMARCRPTQWRATHGRHRGRQPWPPPPAGRSAMRQAARGPAPAAQGGPGMAFPCSILCHYCLHVAPHIRYERVRRRCGDGGGALGGRGALVRGLLKMEEIVSSAITQETVNRIISGLIDRCERKSSAQDHLERLEMAQIKLEFALETSNKWQITSGPLLRWQKKLKRATEECDDTLRKCRQHIQEEDEVEQQVRNSSFPRRIAHATKTLVSSIFHSNSDELGRSSVQRFEWFADGANDFLRSVEFGGTPRRYLFFDPLIGHLISGETLEYKSIQGNKQHWFWVRPNNSAERGIEAKLFFACNDGSAPEDNFYLDIILQLSESTNIVGTTIKCLQLFTPYFESTAETVRKELIQLPTQDFSRVSHSHSYGWENIHSIATEWFRPNPLCCKHHGQKVCGSGNLHKVELTDISLEPIIEVSLLCQVSPPGFREQGTIVEGKSSLKEFPHLNVILVYTPHGSSEDLFPAVDSTVIEVINGNEQHCLHTNVPLEQMEEIMLPRAVDCFRQNAKATAYQMLWKSKHGGAFLQAVKATMNMRSTRRTIRGARKTKMLRRHDRRTHNHRHEVADFLSLWAVHAPVRLQGSLLDWIRKEKKMQRKMQKKSSKVNKLIGDLVSPWMGWVVDMPSQHKTNSSIVQNEFQSISKALRIEYLEKYKRYEGKTCHRFHGWGNQQSIMMSEVVASAVVGEAVSRVSTFFINKHKRKVSEEDGMERLEMAHIRMEAALEMSGKWPPVTDASLLRWRKKLKRASDECSQVMNRCKRRAMEDDEMEQQIRRCSFPRRIAHATRSFSSSFSADQNVDSLITTSTIQRFERFADGAGEFLRFLQFGSIGSINYMLVYPLTGPLLAGKALQFENPPGRSGYCLSARPLRFAERGVVACVFLQYKNHERPEENFLLGILIRVTASTNVVGIMARCSEKLTSNFKPVTEAVRQELAQFHQRGYYCFPFVASTDPEYSRIHQSRTHRARPNPACCEEHEHHGRRRSSDMVEPLGAFPEPVIKLVVQRHVSGTGQKRTSSSSCSCSCGHANMGCSGPPLLQVTAVFAPHASPEELPSGAESVAVVAIYGGSSAHEVFWRSGHGVAYLCVEKMGTEMARCRPTQWRV
uniref:Uncharacterized protein n=1 Tax=Oryza glumipatula TaxID=40148 RepID=A0A0E0AFB9_9ORYZ